MRLRRRAEAQGEEDERHPRAADEAVRAAGEPVLRDFIKLQDGPGGGVAAGEGDKGVGRPTPGAAQPHGGPGMARSTQMGAENGSEQHIDDAQRRQGVAAGDGQQQRGWACKEATRMVRPRAKRSSASAAAK